MKNTRSIALMALLIAFAYASLYVIRFPLLPSASFLRFDIKDVFITIGGLILGPTAAFLGGIIVSVIQILTVSEYGLFGLIMNIFSVSFFVMPVSMIYSRKRSYKSLIYGLIVSCACMTLVMVGWNYIISPLYLGVSRDVIVTMLIPVFLPFNALKSIINAIVILTMWKLIYKHINTLFIGSTK